MAFFFVARFCVTVLAWGRAVSCALQTCGLLLQSMCAPLHVLVVLLCAVVGASSVFWSFLCFSPTLLSLYFIALFLTIVILLFLLLFPLSPWLCVTGAWVGAGFGRRGSWLGCG